MILLGEIPEVNDDPKSVWKNDNLATCFPLVFPACVLTRAQKRCRAVENDLADSWLVQILAEDGSQTLTDSYKDSMDTAESKLKNLHLPQLDLPVTCERLIATQKSDVSLDGGWCLNV